MPGVQWEEEPKCSLTLQLEPLWDLRVCSTGGSRWCPGAKLVLRPQAQVALTPSASFHSKIDRFISHCGLPLLQRLPHFQSEAHRKFSHPTCGQDRASGETPQGTSFLTTEEDVLGSWTPPSGAAKVRAAVAAATVFRPYSSLNRKRGPRRTGGRCYLPAPVEGEMPVDGTGREDSEWHQGNPFLSPLLFY